MSLTQSDGLFIAVHEDGFNDFIAAFFNARPRYLKFGSPFFVGSTNVDATAILPINFPGIPGGIQYMVQFEPPKLDLHPDTIGFALPPSANQFALQIKASITILCSRKRNVGKDKIPFGEPIITTLDLCATGSIDRQANTLGLNIEQLEIKDINPDSLESVIECLMLMMLQSAFQTLRIPYDALPIQIGHIAPGVGPEINDDQVQLTANFV
ncbi:MAG: hypothetical protein ACTSRN_01745 [Alphaproteobacteria bacterium]